MSKKTSTTEVVQQSPEEILNSPVNYFKSISEEDAKKLDEALDIKTIKDLAINHYFLTAQNLYLLSTAKRSVDKAAVEKKHPILELISSITGAALLLASLLYVAGWSYLYQYYKGFGLRISELSIPLYDVLVYSLRVIFSDYFSVVSLFGVIVIFAALLTFKWPSDRLLTPLGIAVSLIIFLSLGAWLSRKGVVLGEAQARNDVMEKDPNLPMVAMKIEPEKPVVSDNPTSANNAADNNRTGTTSGATGVDEDYDKLDYKLLIHSNGLYYFFKPLKGVDSSPVGSIDIFVIPDSRVRRIRIQRGV